MGKLLLPLARTSGLIVEELDNEVLVYDQDNDKAHCLNETNASVWRRCNGTRTAAEIAKLIENDMKVPVDERLVWMALEQLTEHRLLDEPFKIPEVMWGVNRRQMMRNLTLAALVAVPVITSIVAPTAVQAASGGCIAQGQPCSVGVGLPCCPGLTCQPGLPFTCLVPPPP